MRASGGLSATARDLSSSVGDDLDWLRDILIEALALEEVRYGHIDLRVLAEAEMAALNLEFMGKDGPTDVLSFPLDADEPDVAPGDGPPRHLGDIALCKPVAIAQAASHGHQIAQELALLAVHGLLHILGHDHVESSEASLMRERERLLLAHLSMGVAASDSAGMLKQGLVDRGSEAKE